jgi:type IX secretion system PorP/SprF family membrane protein
MKFKKLLFFFSILALYSVDSFSQTSDQEVVFSNAKRDMYAQFTQYSSILALLNPAYCGTTGEMNMMFITREQWGGNISGAPISGALNVNGVFADIGLGWGSSLLYEQYGAQKYFDFTIAGDYIIQITDEQHLSLGIQFSLNSYTFDKSEFGDESIPNGIIHSGYKIPNVGFGIFYYTNKFYAGISSPELMKYDEESGLNDFANVIFDLSSAVFFGYIGYGDVLTEDFNYKTTFLTKYSSFDKTFEANGIITFKEKIGAGLGYRYNGSIVGLVEFRIFKGLDFGYSYDYPIQSSHIDYGSHEIRFNYSFNYEQVEIESSIRYW